MKHIIVIALISFFAENVLLAQTVVFTKADSADWTLPENQDRIADSVRITRKHNQSLFNIAQESGYSGSNGSPLNTLWADTNTIYVEPGEYTNFVSMHGGNTQALINDTVSLYLPQYDEYYDVVFLSYSGGNSGGGFSYSREQVFPLHNQTETTIPKDVILHKNYPNPFNPITTIRYDLPHDAYVNVIIYDMLGRKVKTLVNSAQDAGLKSVTWDATDDHGKPVSSGIYLYQIRTGELHQTKKMILLN